MSILYPSSGFLILSIFHLGRYFTENISVNNFLPLSKLCFVSFKSLSPATGLSLSLSLSLSSFLSLSYLLMSTYRDAHGQYWGGSMDGANVEGVWNFWLFRCDFFFSHLRFFHFLLFLGVATKAKALLSSPKYRFSLIIFLPSLFLSLYCIILSACFLSIWKLSHSFLRLFSLFLS